MKNATRGLRIEEAIYAVHILWRTPGEIWEQTEIIVRGRATMSRAMTAVEQWCWSQGKQCRVRSATRLLPKDIGQRVVRKGIP